MLGSGCGKYSLGEFSSPRHPLGTLELPYVQPVTRTRGVKGSYYQVITGCSVTVRTDG